MYYVLHPRTSHTDHTQCGTVVRGVGQRRRAESALGWYRPTDSVGVPETLDTYKKLACAFYGFIYDKGVPWYSAYTAYTARLPSPLLEQSNPLFGLDLVPAGNLPRPPAAARPLCLHPRLRLRRRSSSALASAPAPTLRLRPHPHRCLRPRRACCRARWLLFVAAQPSHRGLLQRAAPRAAGGVTSLRGGSRCL